MSTVHTIAQDVDMASQEGEKKHAEHKDERATRIEGETKRRLTLISALSISHSFLSRSYRRHSVCKKWRTLDKVKSWPF